MQIRQNCSTKLSAGTLPATISGMLYESNAGSRIAGNPKGRCGIKIHGSEVMEFQGFFAPEDWLMKYRESKGLPIKIYGEDNAIMNSIAQQEEKVDIEEEMSMDEFDELNNF